jgi:hypothetical protein
LLLLAKPGTNRVESLMRLNVLQRTSTFLFTSPIISHPLSSRPLLEFGNPCCQPSGFCLKELCCPGLVGSLPFSPEGSTNPPRSASSGAPKVAAVSGSQPIPKLNDGAPPVNRKKQKKRQNQAARRAAEQQTVSKSSSHVQAVLGNGAIGIGPSESPLQDSLENDAADADNYESREGEIFYSDDESHA